MKWKQSFSLSHRKRTSSNISKKWYLYTHGSKQTVNEFKTNLAFERQTFFYKIDFSFLLSIYLIVEIIYFLTIEPN
jgi:hypothetical protein